ncbi:hypothetical protein FHG71_22115 [Rubellimicrobium roseum]|uniref:MSP domain-containing protein n=2 Tax=Rubellimicrobium roseum TaxID=687525 RepID=A0A5C4N3I0_9RHOB|nr:hypothetical protein FHG71_22115 [Rubellimicrobium roseum]
MTIVRRLMAGLVGILAGASAQAAPLCDDLGFAGLLASCNRGEPIALTLASGQPLFAGEQPVELQSGAYYEIEITADGSAELALSGADFFRSIWINEIVVNDIEIRPMAVDSLEFDDEGTARMSFVAIRPGTFALSIPGSQGETQRVEFAIR